MAGMPVRFRNTASRATYPSKTASPNGRLAEEPPRNVFQIVSANLTGGVSVDVECYGKNPVRGTYAAACVSLENVPVPLAPPSAIVTI